MLKEKQFVHVVTMTGTWHNSQEVQPEVNHGWTSSPIYVLHNNAIHIGYMAGDRVIYTYRSVPGWVMPLGTPDSVEREQDIGHIDFLWCYVDEVHAEKKES